MTDKRLGLILALLPAALLAACNDEPVDEGQASGEVLEGTVSDAMLPIDRVQSEPPLEDPEAFAEAQEEAAEAAQGAATGGEESAEVTDETGEEPPEELPEEPAEAE